MLLYIITHFKGWAKKLLTDDDLLEMLSEEYQPGELYGAVEEAELFSRLAAVDGYTDYLRQTMYRDKDRYFSAESPLKQQQVKGAYGRTLYLYNRLVRANNTKHAPSRSLENPRIG